MRYRLYPSAEQEKALLQHCSDARYVWNLAWNLYQCGTLETYGKASRRTDRDGNEYIHQKRRPVRRLPRYAEQSRMLTEARGGFEWLGQGSVNVQQNALRDFDQAMQNFFGGTHGYPGRRKKHLHEGFRIAGRPGRDWGARRLNRRWGQVQVPKIGWVRFRWTRALPECKSYRVARDRSGRWHVAFTAIPAPIPAPGTGEVVGVDRGVVITAALSTGEMLHCPGLTSRERARLRKAQRRASRARTPAAKDTEYAKAARVKARETDRRKDWCEKVSTDLARRFDVIRVEDLRIKNMTASARGTPEKPGRNVAQKAGLNRAILAQGWGLLVRRITDKAPGRVEKVPAPYTSLRCSDCGWIHKDSRKSQVRFMCANCGFTLNADANASLNIAAGHAGGTPPSVREPLESAA